MKKTYLLTPGPTPIPERVLSQAASPLMHHRTPQFEALFGEVRAGLKKLFETENEVLTLAATGTGAMDAAICNLFSAGDEIITINSGKFGERWSKLGKAFGLKVHELFVQRGELPDLGKLEALITQNKSLKALCFQASETSTGTSLPVKEIAGLCLKHGVLSVCDAITACGVFKMPMDAWQLDVVMTGSQKALMIPPGLSFISLSPKAWKAADEAKLPRFYFDLKRELKAQLKNQTAWTPATALIQGLRETLDMIHTEGLENVFKRHDMLARATRAGVQAMGLEVFSKSPSSAVTAVCVPAAITEGKKIPKYMRDELGVTITGGQDELEGKIFRLAHFGYIDRFDITTALAALELTLNHLGFPVAHGIGVAAALKIFQGELK